MLTASLCLLCSRYLEHWKLVLGAAQLSRPGPDAQERTIKNLVEHQQYVRSTHFNDVALMELSHPINCSDYIQPACLPDTGVEVSSLTHCYVSGWGVTDVSSESSSMSVKKESPVTTQLEQLFSSLVGLSGSSRPEMLESGSRQTAFSDLSQILALVLSEIFPQLELLAEE